VRQLRQLPEPALRERVGGRPDAAVGDERDVGRRQRDEAEDDAAHAAEAHEHRAQRHRAERAQQRGPELPAEALGTGEAGDQQHRDDERPGRPAPPREPDGGEQRERGHGDERDRGDDPGRARLEGEDENCGAEQDGRREPQPAQAHGGPAPARERDGQALHSRQRGTRRHVHGAEAMEQHVCFTGYPLNLNST